MFHDKMNLPFQTVFRKTSESLEIQKRSEVLEKRKPRSDEEIDGFRNAFFLPHLLVGLISLVIIIVYSECFRNETRNSENLYGLNFSFDFNAFLSENATNLDHENHPIWTKRTLIYGDLRSIYSLSLIVPISKRIRSNGSLYLHVYLTKSGFPPGPRKDDSLAEIYTFHKIKRLNFYAKSDDSSFRSFWPSNWTVNLVKTRFNVDMASLRGREEFVDFDPLTSKYYPILYLNDQFNLPKDCIRISQTTERLPLNLTFRQIDLNKLGDYLMQSDLEESFRHRNLPHEAVVRKNLIESDFEKKGFFSDYLRWILAAIVLIKLGLHTLGILQLRPRTDSRAKNGDSYFESSLRLNHQMIFRNLIVFVLLPLLALFPVFISYHLAYFPQENLTIFAILTLCNCICYLGSIYWKSGLFLIEMPLDGYPCPDFWLMIGIQFDVNCLVQLASLTIIRFKFNIVGYTVPEFLAFTLAWLLSDLAVLIHLCELSIVMYGKVFFTKLEKNHLPIKSP